MPVMSGFGALAELPWEPCDPQNRTPDPSGVAGDDCLVENESRRGCRCS
jgi:hypothetical protein